MTLTSKLSPEARIMVETELATADHTFVELRDSLLDRVGMTPEAAADLCMKSTSTKGTSASPAMFMYHIQKWAKKILQGGTTV